MRKWFYRFLFVMVALVLTLVITVFMMSKSKPEGVASAEADALARKVELAINKKAWDNIGAIQWDFGSGRQQHLWDKKRMLARVTFQKGSVVAHFSLGNPEAGLVSVKGKTVTDPAQKKKLLKKAYAWWTNDSFWLNPFVRMFQDGATRKMVTWEGKKQLMIEYSSGGVTPGDAYLYVLGKDNVPTHWHMWVKVIPLKGAKATAEGWKTLYNGAKVSTKHKIMSMLNLKLSKIKAADSVQKLVGSDPFEILVGKAQARPTPQGPSTSRPFPRPTQAVRIPTPKPATR